MFDRYKKEEDMKVHKYIVAELCQTSSFVGLLGDRNYSY